MPKITQIPYKIGITGTIASGKSLVGKILEEKGVPVLDTDKVVASLYQDDNELKQSLAKNFGQDVLDIQGNVNRKALGQIVFNDTHKRKQLESLVHPKVVEAEKQFWQKHQFTNPIRAVLIPLLFESSAQDRYQEAWAVVVQPEEKLLQRLMAREGIPMEEAKKRLSAQWPQAQKAENADRIIDNSGSVEDTRKQVFEALQEIEKEIAACK